MTTYQDPADYLPEFRDAGSGQHLDLLVGYQPWPAPRSEPVTAYLDDADAQRVFKNYADPIAVDAFDTDKGITP